MRTILYACLCKFGSACSGCPFNKSFAISGLYMLAPGTWKLPSGLEVLNTGLCLVSVSQWCCSGFIMFQRFRASYRLKACPPPLGPLEGFMVHIPYWCYNTEVWAPYRGSLEGLMVGIIWGFYRILVGGLLGCI